MTATDELRALLDERGVEHFDGTETTLWGYEPTSESTGVYRFAADETSGGRMQVRMFNTTPEQAVEATLGRGEVERLQDENERLRSCLSDSAENSKQIMHEAHVQEEEIAELRELVRKVDHYERLGCYECPHSSSCDVGTLYDDGCAMSREIEREMRELGIEVDA